MGQPVNKPIVQQLDWTLGQLKNDQEHVGIIKIALRSLLNNNNNRFDLPLLNNLVTIKNECKEMGKIDLFNKKVNDSLSSYQVCFDDEGYQGVLDAVEKAEDNGVDEHAVKEGLKVADLARLQEAGLTEEMFENLNQKQVTSLIKNTESILKDIANGKSWDEVIRSL